MNEHFLFSDESESYRRPHQPKIGDTVIVRFQTHREDCAHVRVWLVHNRRKIQLRLAEIVGELAMYQIQIPPVTGTYQYYFEIEELERPAEEAQTEADWMEGYKKAQAEDRKVTGNLFYTKMGVSREVCEGDTFVIRPGYVVPDWLPGAVMYQIYTDRFCNGNPDNDVLDREYIYLHHPSVRVTDWNALPETRDVYRFYGGDLQGVWNKLDYLQNLGVQVLYMNPIFVSPSNHKYDSQDYEHVDPHLTRIVKDEGCLVPEGETDNTHAERYRCRTTDPENLAASDRFFLSFVREVHRRGMKIILDGVFNHCGSFSKWMDRDSFYLRPDMREEEKGAWHTRRSMYRHFFHFRADKKYESWWEMETLPKLNYEGSRRLRREVLRVAAKWVSEPYCVDGWRLDMAADLGHTEAFNHEFWREFRQVVKKANPNAVILAEHYGDVAPWLSGKEWDTVMNYDAFMEPVSWFLTGMDKHSDRYRPELLGDSVAFFDTMRRRGKAFGNASLQGAMNQLDNHDHSRFLTRTNHMVGRLHTRGSQAASEGISKGVLRQAVVMQMTWPGAPTLYYGDETGVCGWTDPDNRRTYPWGKEDWDLIDFYKYAISIHKQHPALLTGSLIPLLQEKHLLSYGRCLRYDRLVVIINTDSKARTAVVDTRPLGVAGDTPFWRLMNTTEDGYNVGLKLYPSNNAIVTIEMPPVSSVILWEK